MVRRALAVCSTYTLLATEFDKIREIGRQKRYPLSFINTRIGIGLSNFLKRSTTSITEVIESDKKLMYIEIPYAGAATNSFKKQLSRISSKICPYLDVRFFARPPPPVQSCFFNTKDPIPKYLQANIVYSIKCSDYGQIYVGKTERQGIRRLYEHGAFASLLRDNNLICLDYTNNAEKKSTILKVIMIYMHNKINFDQQRKKNQGSERHRIRMQQI
jgi:hypothetical protein